MRLAPRSMVGRVALMSAVGFALSGAIVGLVTGVLAHQLARSQEDEHLRDAAGTLAFELREPGETPERVAEDETRELEHAGMLIAIYERNRFVAGDRRIGALSAGSCQDQATLRACAIHAGRWVAIAARDVTPIREHRDATIFAAGVAVLLTSVLGALLASSAAHIVVRPLWRLRERVERIPEDAPDAAALGSHEDIAEVDALRSSLQTAFTRLGAALAQSRRFAGDAAHQLRTPLTAILGELDLAAERSAGGRDEILHARQVAERLSVLIDRLLILARHEATLEVAGDVDLLEVAEDAIDTLPFSLRARVACAGDSLTVRGDRSLLVTAVVSGIENALKFSSGPVAVGVVCDGLRAQVVIQDDGPGLPPDERERVFAPFYRGKGQDVKGHGIGLAVIAHVMALHGGSAEFGECEKGARLVLALPMGSEPWPD